MHIIPVIDLLEGVVVHAKKGLRAHYQAISSSLTRSSAPIDIVMAFMDLYPFDTLYIADLNGLQKIGLANHKSIDAIRNAFPHLKIWLDSGVNHANGLNALEHTNIQPILSTESFSCLNDYIALEKILKTPSVLSLDFLPNGYQGPIELLQDPTLWPNELIVMTLNQVGTNAGVDSNTITSIIKHAQHQHVYAAGGVRDIHDVQLLQSMGIHGVLVASALHNKQINPHDITSLQ